MHTKRHVRRKPTMTDQIKKAGVINIAQARKLPAKTKHTNRLKFLAMIKTKFPKLYRSAMLKSGNKSRGLGAVGDSWWSNIMTSVQEAIPAALQYRQQKELMDMQLKRAQAGLPPANVADYTPVLKVQTELAPTTRAAFIDQLGKPVIFGGLALAAYMIMKR